MLELLVVWMYVLVMRLVVKRVIVKRKASYKFQLLTMLV